MSKTSLPRRMPGDSEAFNDANDLLQTLGIYYKRPSKHQLKIGDINFYPATGAVTVDGGKPVSEKGLVALEKQVLARRARLNSLMAARASAANARGKR